MKIDTNTNEGKVSVMQAFLEGKRVQSKPHDMDKWTFIVTPVWNWADFDYRIKPLTLEEEAEAYMKGIDCVDAPLMLGDIYNAFIEGAKCQEGKDNG